VGSIQLSSVKSQRLQEEVREIADSYKKDCREFSLWASGLRFCSDQDGNEQLLDADGKQVMMQWEKPYMERCIDVLRIDQDSDVLEIGFGCAYSADRIQLAQPRSHTIIECSPPVLERLRSWALKHKNVKIVEGTWQEKLPTVGIFDCVFFDDFGEPGVADREMQDNCPDPEYREEYAKAVNAKHGTHFQGFLNIVTRWHAKVGTRISGYLHHPVDIYRDDVQALYQHMQVTVPSHCNYFPPGTLWPYALVPLFIKRDPEFFLEEEEDTTVGSQNSPSKSLSPSPSCNRSQKQHRSRSRSRHIHRELHTAE
jgi:hypothetical protein